MSDYKHPMRAAKFHAFVREDGKQAIARAEPYALCPCIFIADTAQEALEKAEAWRADAVAKHEQAYIARQESLAKSRAKRKVKEAST